MKTTKLFRLIFALLASAALFFVGCEKTAGDRLDDAIDETGDAADEARDAIDDAVN